MISLQTKPAYIRGPDQANTLNRLNATLGVRELANHGSSHYTTCIEKTTGSEERLECRLGSEIIELVQQKKIEIKDNVREAVNQFPVRDFLYNRPKELEYRKPNRLVLSVGSSDLKLARQLVGTGSGPSQKASAKLAERVRASLDGPSQQVDIQLESPRGGEDASVRDVNSSSNASWVWNVTPQTLDDVTLTLSIFNRHQTMSGREIESEVPVYRDRFTIRVPFWDRLKGYFTEFSGAITSLGGLIGLLVGIIEILRWRRERAKTELERTEPARKSLSNQRTKPRPNRKEKLRRKSN